MEEKEKRTINLWLFILGAGIFSFSLLKAFSLSITYDEAYCYRHFVRHNILFSDTTSPVNIQLLNNFLMTVCYKLFGSEIFFLRLPNLLAHILFLVFSAKLLKKSMNGWLIIPCFLILNLNPYMLDFFSLARQYGLSFGTMMASIYYLYCFHCEREKNKYAVYSISFGALSVFSSIVQLNFFLMISAAIIALNVLYAKDQTGNRSKKISRFLKRSSLPILISGLVLLTIVPFALAMKNDDQLFFGMSNGFISDTIGSAIGNTFYGQAYEIFLVDILAYVFVFATIAGAGIILALNYRQKSTDRNTGFLGILLGLICLCALSTIVQLHLLGTLLLYNRTAIFFIILFNLVFLFLADQLIKKWKRAKAVLIFVSLFSVLHFFSSLELHRVFEWKQDADTKTMLSDLKTIRDSENRTTQTMLGITLIFEPGIDYYRETKGLTWLNPVQNEAGSVDLGNEYFYLMPWDLDNKRADSLIILKTYPLSGGVLAKRKYQPKQVEIVHQESEDYEGDTDKGAVSENGEQVKAHTGNGYFCFGVMQDYGAWSRIEVRAIPEGRLIGNYSFMALSQDISRINLRVMIGCERMGVPIRYFSADVRDFITENNTWSKGEISFVLPASIAIGDELKAYLWNPEGEKLFVDEVKMELRKEIMH